MALYTALASDLELALRLAKLVALGSTIELATPDLAGALRRPFSSAITLARLPSIQRALLDLAYHVAFCSATF